MATYKQLLMNGLNKIISDLVKSTQPTQAPGSKAWTWFTSAAGASPDDVNTYVAAKITGATATETVFTPDKNWARWATAMQGNFAFAPSNIQTWFSTSQSTLAFDVPTVPDDVITWTKANLPALASVDAKVEVKAGAPSPVGS